MTIRKNLITIATGFSLVAVSGVALAWGVPSLGGSSSGSGSSPAQAAAMQTKIVGEYALGEIAVLKAQSHFALAYGDKKEAAKLEAVAKTLGSGATTEKHLQAATKLSKSASKITAANMAHKKIVTAAGRKQYVEGAGFYGVGVFALTKVVPQFKNFLTAAQHSISTASFTQVLSVKRKLATGMFLAENTPAYVGGLVKTTSQLLSYARKNNIKLPASATSALGNIP